jgi:hypothetical protein
MTNRTMAVINGKPVSWQDCDRSTFESHYIGTLNRFLVQPHSTVGVQILAEQLGEMMDAHPDWVEEIDMMIENQKL